MKKQQICYIDDLSYGILQVIQSIPKNLDYDFYYYNRILDIEWEREFDIVILDYYLDKDNKTSLDIIERFQWTIIITFSSEDACNARVLQNGALYWAKKLKDTNNNSELQAVMKKIFEE